VALASGLGIGLLAAPAAAAPGQAFTMNFHGADAYDQLVTDFLPGGPAPVTLPSGCWFQATDAFMSISGNLIEHGIGNKTGFWYTSTFTGTAGVYPIVFDPQHPGKPLLDDNGNDVVDTTQPSAANGHLTLWFGQEDNNKNGVTHATLTFKGTDSSGNAVQMTGHFQVAFNALGVPTVVNGALTC
jgi:hypothetical protein